MRWLIDEMLPPSVARELNGRGHDAVSVYDLDMAGADDHEVFDRAVADRRVIVTENFADYSLALNARLSRDQPCVPVVFVRKPALPRGGALGVHLAGRLHHWATANPDPYVGPHWP